MPQNLEQTWGSIHHPTTRMPLSIPSRHILQVQRAKNLHQGGVGNGHPIDLISLINQLSSTLKDLMPLIFHHVIKGDQLLCGPNNLKHHPAMGHIMSSDSLELKELLNLLVPSVSHIPEPHKVAQFWLISAVSFILHYDAIPSTVSDPILWFRFKNTFDANSPPGPGPNTYPWLGFAASSCSWKALL